MTLVQCKDLTYNRGAKTILKSINWKVEKGERWIVLGNNGCGKTSLVSILAGYREWTNGDIMLFDSVLNPGNAMDLRKRIGFVSSSFFDNCLKYENGIDIVLGGYMGQIADGIDITDKNVLKAKKILEALGLKHKCMYPYDLLSRGQRQKILLARAFLNKPELLILDEPCSGLDLLSRDYVLNTLQDIIENTDCGIIYVTHHVDEILPSFTHAILLKNKSVHSQGKIEDVFSEHNMTDFFNAPTEVQRKEGHIYFRIAKNLCMDKMLWSQ